MENLLINEYYTDIVVACIAGNPLDLIEAMGFVYPDPDEIPVLSCVAATTDDETMRIIRCKLKAEEGIKINLFDYEGYTPLLWAVSFIRPPNTGVVLTLLEEGADVNAQSKNGYTPLILCCTMEHIELVKILLKYKPDLNIMDCEGNTAFMHMCKKRYLSKESIEIATLLLEHNTKLILKNKEGKTALMMAKEHNNIEILNMIN